MSLKPHQEAAVSSCSHAIAEQQQVSNHGPRNFLLQHAAGKSTNKGATSTMPLHLLTHACAHTHTQQHNTRATRNLFAGSGKSRTAAGTRVAHEMCIRAPVDESAPVQRTSQSARRSEDTASKRPLVLFVIMVVDRLQLAQQLFKEVRQHFEGALQTRALVLTRPLCQFKLPRLLTGSLW
eukprot:1141378-Pelagomonas_calceolata.AAC.1